MRLAVGLLALSACDPAAFGPQPAPTDKPHTQGSVALPIETPATDPDQPPTASRPQLSSDAGDLDASVPPPRPEPFETDAPPDRELGIRRDVPGVTLAATWRGRDVPSPLAGPLVDETAVASARALTTGGWRIHIADDGHLRVQLMARAQPLPESSVLLSRWDRYGTLLVWPDASLYRVVVAGALRAVLAERRADVSPLAPGRPQVLGEGERLGLPTRRVELRSPIGGVRLELAELPEAGLGGPLLCRMLVELAAIDPATTACAEAEVPLTAEYSWGTGEGAVPPVVFEITALSKHGDLSLETSFAIPDGALYTRSGLPGENRGAFFAAEELAAFRRGAAPGPGEGELSLAVNRSDLLMYVLLDGVPVAAVEPWRETLVPGLVRGKYVVQWRSFFGEVIGEPAERDLPGRLVHGQPEAAETPDAGK
jgi:hypothetical protein